MTEVDPDAPARTLAKNQGLALAALEAMPGPVMIADRQGRLRYQNPSASQIIMAGGGQAGGSTLFAANPSLTKEAWAASCDLASGGGGGTNELSVTHAGVTLLLDARLVAFDCDGEELFLFYGHDVTARAGQTKALERMATLDVLTGLPNRQGFEAAYRRFETQGPLTVAFIDLNGFKEVNDVHGHGIGDALLVAVAGRLRGSFRADEFIARLGGDEFTAIIPSPGKLLSEGGQLALRIEAAFVEAFSLRPADALEVEPTLVQISASVGVAECPRDAQSLSELLAIADRRMYGDKRRRTGD